MANYFGITDEHEESFTVDRGCTPVPQDAMKLLSALLLFFASLHLTRSGPVSVALVNPTKT